MRENIHPAYAAAKVHCACGNNWETRSTGGDLHLDICSACHPFFTGKQKLMDTQGRIERFRKKYEAGLGVSKAAAETAARTGQPAVPEKAEPKAAAPKPTEPKAEKAPKAPKEKKPKAPKAAGETPPEEKN